MVLIMGILHIGNTLEETLGFLLIQLNAGKAWLPVGETSSQEENLGN